MLTSIGVRSIEELFPNIPSDLRLPSPKQDDGLSEFEGMRLMEALAAKNTFPNFACYLGGGAYEHHVPAIVGAICSKSGFLTSYTPYQAEASQGFLQAIFEFQSAICALTGLDVANASVYDGASACAESLLMALRYQSTRTKVLVTESLHPQYRGVIELYLDQKHVQIIEIPFLEDGRLDAQFLMDHLDDDTAAVLVQSPNFLGVIEEIKELVPHIQKKGALAILCANPLAYGLYASPKELGIDIAVGDCQPFGLPLQYGGPYAGYMACKQDLVRQLPGRLVGETVDAQGNRGFVLTLQAREQHIRREKATSNICTSQTLATLASLVAILWYGKQGIHDLALTNYQRATYLKEELVKIPGVKALSGAPFFNEFAVKFPKPLQQVLEGFRKEGIEPGIPLGRFFPKLKDYLLIAVTETKSKEQLNHYIKTALQA